MVNHVASLKSINLYLDQATCHCSSSLIQSWLAGRRAQEPKAEGMLRFIQFLTCLVLIGVCSCWHSREGEPCTPKWGAQTCGERILISETVTELSEEEGYGPNLCRTERVYSVMQHSYAYKRRCCFFFCFLHCAPSGECDGEEVNVTKSQVDCCEGFGVDPSQSTRKGRDVSRYRRHGFKESSLKSNGCPIMLRDSVLDCLVDLNLTSLLTKVANAPELLESLSDLDADFTIFGPTDEAFEGLSDLDRPSSREVLGGHVVNRTIFSSRLRQRQILTPFDEEFALHVTTVSTGRTSREIYINGANIIQGDACQATNGIVHVLSSVIPLSNETIAEVLASQSRFSIFLDLLGEADITKYLERNEKSRTVFVPTNEAFNKLPPGAVECFLRSENRRKLKKLVLIHIISPTEYSSTLSQRSRVQTFTYYRLVISTEGDSIFVTRDQIEVEEADIPASNGVVHVLPEVILPFDIGELCPGIEMPATTTEGTTEPPATTTEATTTEPPVTTTEATTTEPPATTTEATTTEETTTTEGITVPGGPSNVEGVDM